MANTHFYSFTRDKGIITFVDETADKSYLFNINRGELTSGATGKPIKSCPAGFGKFLENYYGDDLAVRLMGYARRDPRSYGLPTNANGYLLRDFACLTQIANLFNLLDRAQSLGASVGTSYWRVLSLESLRELEKYFKDFAKYCRSTENPTLGGFLNEDGAIYFAARHNLDKYHLTDDDVKFIYERRNDIPADKIPVAAYHIARGLRTFAGNSTMGYLRRYFELADKLGIDPPKEDFYRSFINMTREYEMRKQEIDMATLLRHYDKQREALSFENDKFMVVIPQTTQDFEREANSQHNCVFSMYLSKVLAGDTHVVFVRRKDAPNTSLITCEVRDGYIRQYLLRYNEHPTDDAMLNFRTKYAEHLAKTWRD